MLNCAIPVRKKSKILCFYDDNIRKYIKFHPESKKKGTSNYNIFHAFHIEDEKEVPEKTKKLIHALL